MHLAEPTRLSETVADLSAFRPDAIFAPAQNIVSLLKNAKVLTPIVAIAVNPVGSGLAASLARPGGNITGFTLDAGMATIAKRVELLRKVVPAMSRLAVLILRPYWEGRFGVVFQQVAQQLGITAIGAPFESQTNENDYQQIFADVVRAGGDSLYVTPAPGNLAHRQLIADLAIESRLPSVNFYRENVEAGGLMGYGPDIVDTFRQAAGYLDLIFKGANPAEMPFQQPTKFELTLNLKTAKALELSIPPNLLALATAVIE
jgi:putative ABC transport system substrate-binding protein